MTTEEVDFYRTPAGKRRAIRDRIRMTSAMALLVGAIVWAMAHSRGWNWWGLIELAITMIVMAGLSVGFVVWSERRMDRRPVPIVALSEPAPTDHIPESALDHIVPA